MIFWVNFRTKKESKSKTFISLTMLLDTVSLYANLIYLKRNESFRRLCNPSANTCLWIESMMS